MAMRKRRQRVYKKVTRKFKSSRRQYVDLKKQYPIQNVRQKWNNKLSINQNMEHLKAEDFVQTLPNHLTGPIAPSLSERDTLVITALVKKHQDNVEAMARDIKCNIYQWTASQCLKKYKIFVKDKDRATLLK